MLSSTTQYFVIEADRNVYNPVLKYLHNTVIQNNDKVIIVLEGILNKYVNICFVLFFLNMTCSTHFTAGVKAQEEEVPSQFPEANVRGDMIPQTPKDQGKNHCFV